MKKYIKKTIVGIFAFAVLFTGQSVFAATWNGASNDCPSINVANATTGAGWNDPCWTGTNIKANPGDTVNVRVYYHNTGTTTATNTKVYLDVDTEASTSHRFSGSITSGAGNLSFGPVYITTNPAQSLSFGTVKWYTENTKETLTPLLSGQDGSEILDSGLSIGSIAPGWATQGSLVISFKVSNNTTPEEECSISNFSVSPTSIYEGDTAKLSWSTENCNSASISGIGSVSVSGTRNVYPTSTTTYSLTAYGNNSQDSSSVKVIVNPVIVENMTGNISASPSSCTIQSGNSTCSTTLSWTTTN
ncbi:MAG: hypothetical protein EOM85_01180, partial [Candidatus Moranbacteria bacterium]|nr:hypothetical protein [Candidatus Moranbacteria bacterium]